MNVPFYLYIRRGGTKYSPRPQVRVTKTKGNTASDEIVIAVNLDVPEALFNKPQLTASITIPQDVVPEEIKAETIDNIKETLRQSLDLKINFEVENIDYDNNNDD